MDMEPLSRVLVLVNPKAGLPRSFHAVRAAFDRVWDDGSVDLSYQFTQSAEDGAAKARRAVDAGVRTVIAVGGDGTVSTVGRALLGSDVNLAVIPFGSGNGLARHFNIPLTPARAVEALRNAVVRRIDVGMVDERPFFVTCSMAWDGALVRSFDRMPVRGILPYVLAGVQEFFEYKQQDIGVTVDGTERRTFREPMVFTVANLSQYGGGARIAPSAQADDGFLELVVALRQDLPVLLANIGRFFDGSIERIPQVESLRFRRLEVRRERSSPIQMDGELVNAGVEISVRVVPAALNVLVPAGGSGRRGANRSTTHPG
jgi:YegS/Rv2252/BmrU family lipid kinase